MIRLRTLSYQRSTSVAVLTVVGLLACVPLAAQHPETTRQAPIEGQDFVVYEADGDIASFADILAELDDHEVVLVGEQHDDMIGHGFQTSLLIAAFQRLQPEREVVLSMEMFERDVQHVVDEYLEGLISEDHFLRSARPWDDYENRYRPMVEFARAHGLDVVAANAPRRYVNRVSREGPESLGALGELARSYLPPLPYAGPSDEYRAQWDAVMAAAMEEMRAQVDSAAAEHPTEETDEEEAAPPQHYTVSPNVIYSQALWDAAMGHSVVRALADSPGAMVIHMAGSFHVERETGIPERIEEYRPRTRLLSIVMVKAESVDAWDDEEHEDLGDYVVLTQAPDAETAAPGN